MKRIFNLNYSLKIVMAIKSRRQTEHVAHMSWLFNEAVSTETIEWDGRITDECGALTRETEVLGENPLQCHFVHHKSPMIWPRIEAGSPRVGTQ
jgi:hypothetical protein